MKNTLRPALAYGKKSLIFNVFYADLFRTLRYKFIDTIYHAIVTRASCFLFEAKAFFTTRS
jgi:hypothetical protein